MWALSSDVSCVSVKQEVGWGVAGRAKGAEEVPRGEDRMTGEHQTGPHLQPLLAATEQRRSGTQDWGPILTCLSLFSPSRPEGRVQTLEVD